MTTSNTELDLGLRFIVEPAGFELLSFALGHPKPILRIDLGWGRLHCVRSETASSSKVRCKSEIPTN